MLQKKIGVKLRALGSVLQKLRVLLKNIIVAQLGNKFPGFYDPKF